MARVKVTFIIEGDDPAHATGVSGDQYDEITDAIMQVGGSDIQFEPEDEG